MPDNNHAIYIPDDENSDSRVQRIEEAVSLIKRNWTALFCVVLIIVLVVLVIMVPNQYEFARGLADLKKDLADLKTQIGNQMENLTKRIEKIESKNFLVSILIPIIGRIGNWTEAKNNLTERVEWAPSVA